MNKVFFLIILLTYVLSATAQDVIVGTSGKNIYYKVIKVDYSDVYYYLNDDIFKHSISRNDVKKIQYGSQFPNSSIKGSHFNLNEPKSSITVGLLEGGGSLIGFDLEMMYSKSASIQLWAGFVGFGASINLHLKPTIRSTYISLQYWHQGFRETYTQSLIGPSLVFRAKRIFTCQIGFAFAFEKGPGWPANETQPPVELTYAIGVYFPF